MLFDKGGSRRLNLNRLHQPLHRNKRMMMLKLKGGPRVSRSQEP